MDLTVTLVHRTIFQLVRTLIQAHKYVQEEIGIVQKLLQPPSVQVNVLLVIIVALERKLYVLLEHIVPLPIYGIHYPVSQEPSTTCLVKQVVPHVLMVTFVVGMVELIQVYVRLDLYVQKKGYPARMFNVQQDFTVHLVHEHQTHFGMIQLSDHMHAHQELTV